MGDPTRLPSSEPGSLHSYNSWKVIYSPGLSLPAQGQLLQEEAAFLHIPLLSHCLRRQPPQEELALHKETRKIAPSDFLPFQDIP